MSHLVLKGVILAGLSNISVQPQCLNEWRGYTDTAFLFVAGHFLHLWRGISPIHAHTHMRQKWAIFIHMWTSAHVHTHICTCAQWPLPNFLSSLLSTGNDGFIFHTCPLVGAITALKTKVCLSTCVTIMILNCISALRASSACIWMANQLHWQHCKWTGTQLIWQLLLMGLGYKSHIIVIWLLFKFGWARYPRKICDLPTSYVPLRKTSIFASC